MSKEIFIHYSDSNSMLLPKSILVVDDNLSQIHKILKTQNISQDDVTLAKVKNYKNLSIFCNINGEKSFPKDFTLLSFDIPSDKKITIECDNKREEVKILDIALKHHKDWVFKTEKLSYCKAKEDVLLVTPNAKIKMTLKRNKTYAKLLYKSDKSMDKLLYPYLIHLEESLFVNYFAYSKFFVSQESKLTKEAQEHAKMLNSLFKIIFAKKRQRILLNHQSYSFLTAYKKIPFSITPLNKEYQKSLTVLDEVGLNITNTKIPFHNNLILSNLSSLPNINYDKSLIFCKKAALSKTLFSHAIEIKRSDFNTVKQSASIKINTTIYLTVFILFILMLALINSFISRNYKLYNATFSILIFHGFHFKIVTLLLTTLLLATLFLAYLISAILLNEVNTIFNLYYVDLIRLNFEYNYIFGFFILSIVVSYIYESKAQKSIIHKAKGR